MSTQLSSLDRRKFLRGVSGFALALPCFETFAKSAAAATNPKRLACFYQPDGVPMPRVDDPAFKEFSWFPHNPGRDFRLANSLRPLEPLRDKMTVVGGMSHPAVRRVHGHSNADQFLTGADTGAGGDYQNSISLDQYYANVVGDETRVSSLVLSTDGGTGSPRGAQTLSFNQAGRPIPAENRPKRIFDRLFVSSGKDAERRLAISQSALDDLMGDANSLRKKLSGHDQDTLDEYLQSVRDTEIRVEKARRWLDIPMPQVDVSHLNLDVTPDDPRNYVQTMYELIYLAFRTDSTRVATWQIGRENGVGASDYLARAIGYNLTHQLSHNTKKPDGWEQFSNYCNFLMEEYGRFLQRLQDTPEPTGNGTMLDNTLTLFGSASSAFHLSRNYPIVLTGGSNLGFKHGQYLKFGTDEDNSSTSGISSDKGWRSNVKDEERPLSDLYLTMLHRLGVETDSFGGSETTVSEA